MLTQLLLNAANIVDDWIKDEFVKQGHELTGTWQQSLIHQEVGYGEVEGVALAYGMIVNDGVIAEKIPFGGITGVGGESKYIKALQKYTLLRNPGMSEKKALRIAFATAIVQKEEGMSTVASEQYSATGQRQRFLDSLRNLFINYLDEWVFEGIDNIINIQAKEPKRLYL